MEKLKNLLSYQEVSNKNTKKSLGIKPALFNFMNGDGNG